MINKFSDGSLVSYWLTSSTGSTGMDLNYAFNNAALRNDDQTLILVYSFNDMATSQVMIFNISQSAPGNSIGSWNYTSPETYSMGFQFVTIINQLSSFFYVHGYININPTIYKFNSDGSNVYTYAINQPMGYDMYGEVAAVYQAYYPSNDTTVFFGSYGAFDQYWRVACFYVWSEINASNVATQS